MKVKYLKINSEDNVVVALSDLAKGDVIQLEDYSFTLKDNVKAKHKFLQVKLNQGDEVKMYGIPVGKINQELDAGSLLTTENTVHFASAT